MKLHIWIAKPRSLIELSTLESLLQRTIPTVTDDWRVVFEDRLLSIDDLAGGFTHSDDVTNEVARRAAQIGAESATAMFGVVDALADALDLTGKVWPRGISYLGSFVIEDEDSELEPEDEDHA